MGQQKIASPDAITHESDPVASAPPPQHLTDLGKQRNSGNGGEPRERKPPKIRLKLIPGGPVEVDLEPIEAVRLLSAFGTAELSFASLMLNGVINVTCDKREPESARINEA